MVTISRLLGWALPAALAFGLAAPALADGRIFVPVPDLSSIEGKDAERMLDQLILAVVVGSNCPGAELTDAEWSLLIDSADVLAHEQLGLSIGEYDDQVFGPAFDALDAPGTCEKVGPKIGVLLDTLLGMGGSLEPYPDQDAALAAWNAQQDIWAEL